MSFRKKNKDMKIAHASDSPQPSKKQQRQQQRQQEATATSNEPPDGTSAEVKAWVGDDPQKAKAALDKEQSHEKPRSGLTEDLQEVIDKASTSDDSSSESTSTSTTNEDGDTTTTTTTTTETETSTKTDNE